MAALVSELTMGDGIEVEGTESPRHVLEQSQARGHGGVVGAVGKLREMHGDREPLQRLAQAAVCRDAAADNDGFRLCPRQGPFELLYDHIDARGLEAGGNVRDLWLGQLDLRLA